MLHVIISVNHLNHLSSEAACAANNPNHTNFEAACIGTTKELYFHLFNYDVSKTMKEAQIAMENENTLSQHILTQSSALSLPRTSSARIEHLIEYTTIPSEAIVEKTVPPVVSPYNIYRKYGSLTKSIRSLVTSKDPPLREYVQSSKMDQCSLPATCQEQYVTLTIPPEYIEAWKKEGYTHLHLGAVRLVLSYNGRKGLPVTARLALLDTRYIHYEHAVIGTVLTTLNAGSVVITFFPNYALSLKDVQLDSTFKVQIQISGAEQTPNSYMATLHHQIVYRLQNHSLDLKNQGTADALMVLAEAGNEVPTIVQIPRQINRQDLEKLVPTEWITNYESLHEVVGPVQATEFKFEKMKDGKTKTVFKPPREDGPSTPMFQLMIAPVSFPREKCGDGFPIPITSFKSDGRQVYTDMLDGHFLWGGDPSMCDPRCDCAYSDDSDDDDDEYSLYNDDDEDYYGDHRPYSREYHPYSHPQPCLMLRSSEVDFPAPSRHEDVVNNIISKPYIQSTVMEPGGQRRSLNQGEEVLNWQTNNARAQNQSLQIIDSKVSQILEKVQVSTKKVNSIETQLFKIEEQLSRRISQVDNDLRYLISKKDFGPEFSQKEAEIRSLKREMQKIEEDKNSGKTLFLPPATYSPPESPEYSKYFGMVSSIPLDIPKRSKKKEAFKGATSEEESHPTQTFMISKLPRAYAESSNSYNHEHGSDDEERLADISAILMADSEPAGYSQPFTETVSEESEDEEHRPYVTHPTEDRQSKPNSGPWFSFDDIPIHKRRDRMHTFAAWIDNQLNREDADLRIILKEFTSRFLGTLREWFLSLGEYRQRQVLGAATPGEALGEIHREFIGDLSLYTKAISQEYFSMKCCSLSRKDLDWHFKRMSERFYCLNGYNDPNLKNVYVASLPKELQPEMARMIQANRKDISSTSMGQIHQICLAALDKLCEQQNLFKEMMERRKIPKSVCDKSYLEIKCKDKECKCSSSKKKKQVFNKFRKKEGKKQHRFFRRKAFRKKNTNRCYLCNKEGHFARNCPNKQGKSAKLASQAFLSLERDSEDADIESIFSEQDEQDEDTTFILQDSSSDEDYSDADSSEDGVPILMIQPNLSARDHMIVHEVMPSPHLEVRLLQSKYDRPIKAIGVLDTGARRTMLNPDILPKDAWETHHEYFYAADGQTFHTSLISKHPVGIQLFHDCTVWIKVIGSKLHGHDLLMGFDLFYKAQRLQILPLGVRYKRKFLAFTTVQKLFSLQEVPADYHHLGKELQKCCADSHAEFKHPTPLWKNKEFFVQLPFKKNEDINATKATHPGMNPEELALATEECNQLLSLGLIEPTKSNWACQAFYVNNRAEQLRGKKRLVIDYKPLNFYLLDDKFPLPRTQMLFSQLSKAKLFSKFDLKSGFWQLGILPEDRYKTAFCIPTAQYQWTVMPFGLKVAPSLFQKAMTKMFEPILYSTLIYIDDILLYSKTKEEHYLLIKKFLELVQSYGVMLSEKKSIVGQPSIEFLGMKISDGQFQPGPHIAQELQKFPDNNLSIKEIQQFLGIINYVKDFIPDCSRHTSQLSKLLKKNASVWGSPQTLAVQHLKKICQDLRPLRIPGEGQRILQTDASDNYWGAILLERVQGKTYYCAHASGQFKDSEHHYHAIYKEILAVKNGIKKFEFHLVGYNFIVQLDNTSFPAIMELKHKGVPEKQLLRLKDWFSKYQFSVEHIKGKDNIIPDYLSRQPFLRIITSKKILPVIFMVNKKKGTNFSGSEDRKGKSILKSPKNPFLNYPPKPLTYDFSFPPSDKPFKTSEDVRLFARRNLFKYLSKYVSEIQKPYESACFDIHKPFLTVTFVTLHTRVTLNCFWYLWCLSALFHHVIEVCIEDLIAFFRNTENDTTLLWELLTWYATPSEWLYLLYSEMDRVEDQMENPHMVLMCHRPYSNVISPGLNPIPLYYKWKTLPDTIQNNPRELKELYINLCHLNKMSHEDVPEKLLSSSLSLTTEAAPGQPSTSKATDEITRDALFFILNREPWVYPDE